MSERGAISPEQDEIVGKQGAEMSGAVCCDFEQGERTSVLNLLNLNTALFTEVTGNSCIQLFYKRHPMSESGFTETYIQPLGSFFLAKNGPNLHALL